MTEIQNKDNLAFIQPSLSVDEIFGVIPDLIFVLDRNSIILEYRAGNIHDLYLQPKDFLGKAMVDVLPTETALKISNAIAKASQSKTVEVVEYQLAVAEANKWFEARICASVCDRKGNSHNNRFIMLVRDITDNKAKEEQITYHATHDHLTGLYNRSFTFDYINHKLQEAARQNQATAILFIDVDEFKQINDQFGHDVGDQVLVAIANALTDCLRKEDLVSRIGGDEFLVMIGGDAAFSDLAAIVSKIETTLDKHTKAIHPELKTTVSIGASVCEHGNTELTELIRQVDIAMYDNKKAGNGGVCLYQQDKDN